MKYRSKQKKLLLFHVTNTEFKEVIFWKYKLKMSDKFKDISIKNHRYYFYDGIISIKDFDSNKIKIDEKSYQNILT